MKDSTDTPEDKITNKPAPTTILNEVFEQPRWNKSGKTDASENKDKIIQYALVVPKGIVTAPETLGFKFYIVVTAAELTNALAESSTDNPVIIQINNVDLAAYAFSYPDTIPWTMAVLTGVPDGQYTPEFDNRVYSIPTINYQALLDELKGAKEQSVKTIAANVEKKRHHQQSATHRQSTDLETKQDEFGPEGSKT